MMVKKSHIKIMPKPKQNCQTKLVSTDLLKIFGSVNEPNRTTPHKAFGPRFGPVWLKYALKF